MLKLNLQLWWNQRKKIYKWRFESEFKESTATFSFVVQCSVHFYICFRSVILEVLRFCYFLFRLFRRLPNHNHYNECIFMRDFKNMKILYVRTSTTSSSIKFELLRQHSLVGAFALNSTYYWMTKTSMKLNFNYRIINYISKKFYLRYILFVNFNL